jgi:hypothetical protein
MHAPNYIHANFMDTAFINSLKLNDSFILHEFQHSNITHSPYKLNFRVLYGSQNKQRLFPYTALTYWFLQPRSSVFTARYDVNI